MFQSSSDNDGLPDKITDFFPGIVYIFDADTRKLKYINRKITDLLGYSLADVLTWGNDLMRIVHKDDQDHVNGELQHFYTLQDNESYSYTTRLTDKYGSWKHFRTMGTVLNRDTSGRVITVLFVAQDITTELENQLNLEEKIRDLDRSNKELEEFAYVASHDMNEPLRKITTFIERLENKYKAELGADGKLYLTRISASIENMRHLIDTLLEFSRTTRSNQPFAPVDLNGVAKDVQTDLELKIEETGTTLHIAVLPVIEAIPSQMKQLFDNLINNSIKFRKSGVHPVINIRCLQLTRRQKEQHHLDAANTWFRIDFADNGIGFEPEYNERIFQIFQRLHGKSEFPGSGIGLAICKKIIDQHKGLIYATGKPDNGATFTIILPEHQ
ncbi:sensor histidine kinase [Niastella koreensis]|uniref:sensor histidine kinase n=1 Tax=Niastella koreensis TaxID=354356 RepID=UPI0002E8EB1E|nr:PAS domain-containing sensor histidine kinase [Niastella koreensis]